jgi:hypothetical protein
MTIHNSLLVLLSPLRATLGGSQTPKGDQLGRRSNHVGSRSDGGGRAAATAGRLAQRPSKLHDTCLCESAQAWDDEHSDAVRGAARAPTARPSRRTSVRRQRALARELDRAEAAAFACLVPSDPREECRTRRILSDCLTACDWPARRRRAVSGSGSVGVWLLDRQAERPT